MVNLKTKRLLVLCTLIAASAPGCSFAAEPSDIPFNLNGYRKIEDLDFNEALAHAHLNLCLVRCYAIPDYYQRLTPVEQETLIKNLRHIHDQAQKEFTFLSHQAATIPEINIINYDRYQCLYYFVSGKLEYAKRIHQPAVERTEDATDIELAELGKIIRIYQDYLKEAKAIEAENQKSAHTMYLSLIRDGSIHCDIPEIVAIVAETRNALERLNGAGRSSSSSTSSSSASASQDQSNSSSTVLSMFSKLKFW